MSELLSLAVTAVEQQGLGDERPQLWAIGELAPAPRVAASKRAVDLLVATLGLVAFAIPMLVIAVAVKCTSRGPVLFTQQRVGEGGALFAVKKFRTMRDGTHAEVLADDRLHAAYRDNDYKLPA